MSIIELVRYIWMSIACDKFEERSLNPPKVYRADNENVMRRMWLAFLDGTTMSIIELVRYIWMSNACVKFEERSLNPSKVITETTKK